MRLTQAFIDLSSSMTVYTDKRGHETDQFKWNNIKNFIYFAFTFASSSSNFDIFSHVYENVRLLDFLVCELIMGMPYMFMDFFIRQYTRKLDFNRSLNPLLKGISFAILLQSALWAMLHASDLADSIRFLASSLRTEPSWSKCQKNITCISFKQMIIQCRANNFTKFNVTSAHINYLRSFTYFDKNVLTTRFFASALVWIFNFFCTTVTAETLLKIFKVTYLWRFFSTLVILFVIICSKKQDAAAAFAEILDVTAPTSFAMAMDHVTYAYGIGFVGVYDFETMSPYTMVDNAVVIFTIVFTVSAFARSLIVKILYLVLTSCVQVEISITPHYLLFAILPYSTEFFYGHKLYIIYIFVNLMLATTAYLAMLTLSLSKLLHSEFQSVKSMYIVGLLCFLGFSLSVPITIQSMTSSSRIQGLVYGLKCTVLYLGGFRVAIVMWMYGVRRFSTDILFWLDFKPTKFWTICWMFLPVLLFSFFINRVYELIRMPDFTMLIAAVSWIVFSLIMVAIFHVRTVARYIIRNNIAKAFSSSAKYGPPEPEDRKRRRIFNETIQLRRCVHNCNILDNSFDCNHLPLRFRSKSRIISETSLSENSLEHIFVSPSKMRKSSVVETIW